jgi:hypothetical protein
LQSARFVTFAIVAMDVRNGQAESAIAIYAIASDLLCLVGGIVEDLNLQNVAWVIKLRSGFDQAVDDVPFVVNRKLNGNFGPSCNFGGRARDIFAIFVIVINQGVAMNAVGGQDNHHEKIRKHDGKIKRIELIDAAKGIGGGVHVTSPKIGEGVTGGEPSGDGEKPIMKRHHDC